jgi:hypothetical protein
MGQDNLHLRWRITKAPDGTLTKLTVDPGDGQPAGAWEREASIFIASVTAAALSERRQRFFFRTLFFYIGPQLDGEYWLPGYRFAPAYPDDPSPHLINAERIVSIDQDVNAIDGHHASLLADEAARRTAARLSLLMDIGLYCLDGTERWVWPMASHILPTEPLPTQSVRYPLGFKHSCLSLPVSPGAKGKSCPLGKYQGRLLEGRPFAGELLSLPKGTRKILRSMDQGPVAVADAFDCGARLWQVATVCGRQFPSVGLAYRVAAVEAISEADPKNKGFSRFMRRYLRTEADAGDFLSYLHGVIRSSHFHAGAFPAGEYDRGRGSFSPFMDVRGLQLESVNRDCRDLTREAIVNWIGSVVQASAANDTGDIES